MRVHVKLDAVELHRTDGVREQPRDTVIRCKPAHFEKKIEEALEGHVQEIARPACRV